MFRSVRYGIAAIAMGLALTAVACSSGGAAAPADSSGSAGSSGGQTIAVKLSDDMKFNPAPIKVKAGQPVTLQIENTGAIPHDLTIEGLDTQVSKVVEPKKTDSVQFTASKAGTYKVVCHQPGHEAAGMVTELIVE